MEEIPSNSSNVTPQVLPDFQSVSVPTTTITPESVNTYSTGSHKKWWLVLTILILLILGTGIYFSFTSSESSIRKTSLLSSLSMTETPSAPSQIIVTSYTLDIEKGEQTITLESIDLNTRQKATVHSFPVNTILIEAQVAPNGESIYFLEAEQMSVGESLTLLDKNGQEKKFSFSTANEVWNPASTKSCYWSLDSQKIGCFLSGSESHNGGGNGKNKLIVIDIENGTTTEISSVPQNGSTWIRTAPGGWLDDQNFIIIQAEDELFSADLDLPKSNFYAVNILSQEVQTKFSYQYDVMSNSFVSVQNKNLVFFDAFSRVNADKFVKYDLTQNAESVLDSDESYLGVKNPVISPDQKFLIYLARDNKLYIHDIETQKLRTVDLPFTAMQVEAALADNKTFIISVNEEKFFIFNADTAEYAEGQGTFRGMGSF